MSSSPDPRWPVQSDDSPKRRPKNPSSGAHIWHPPINRSLAWEMGPLGMLS